MAKTFKPGLGIRLSNPVFGFIASRGWGPPRLHALSVKGRKTGRVQSVPVGVMEVDGRRYLVAAYGITHWVRNARSAGEVTLTRSGHAERYKVTEVDPDEAVPVLRKYVREVRVVRAYFDASPDSTDEEFMMEVKNHPVFRLDPASA